MLPRLAAFATPIVADAPPAVLGGLAAAAAWSSSPPHPATASATSGIAAAAVRRDRGLLRVILRSLDGLARRLHRSPLVVPLRRRERLLEAADRRAEAAPGLRQSLGAEHDQCDGEDHEQMRRVEEALDQHRCH